ncbi:response regulator [Stigmatella hybrida]|uniref:response regulator n=1 Tax=Stigmatella hybrida TaxID=394097 RepID=UPI001CDB2D98|nr:response regulator [Stigmatella hybrida]
MSHIDFETLFKHSPNPYMVLDREFRYVTANEAYLRLTASRLEELRGRNIFEAFPHDPENRDNQNARQLRDSFVRVLTQRVPDFLAVILYRVPKEVDGRTVIEERYWSATHTPLFDASGEVAYILQHTMDITELQQLKQAVKVSQEPRSTQMEANVLLRAQAVQEANRMLDEDRRHLLRLFGQAPGFMAFLRGQHHVFEMANAAYLQVVGHRDITGKTVRDALPELVGQGYYELLDRVFASGEPFVGRAMELHVQRHPGAPLEQAWVDFVYQPIRDADGTVSGIFVQGHDITEQKRAQDELRRYREHLEELVQERTRELAQSEAERQKTEAALRQAQKMEAVGKLTGGVAHDFNNLLQVISGNLQLLYRDVTGNERAQRRVQTAIGAVDRGARLASQLLAFARRQPLEPKVLHLGRLVRSMDELLRRALGESIELETVVGGGLWNTLVDPNQLENVLLNLAINARDAMEGEGKLTIEAGNAMLDDHYALLHPDVTPGQYVVLAVSDTGCGMSPEILERAFEPFFTTKTEGRGTGLGLSMVYGFVKQTGGHIKIYSEVGHGTTIRIYLPRTLQAEVSLPEIVTGPIEGGSETILVVEDDAEVRTTVVELLTELGYRVLKANDGQMALAVLQSGMPIDLVFTDVVMPGPVRSPELARQAKALFPNIQVLFTSGYTENAIVHGGRLDPGVSLLSKPYRKEDLARKLRQMFRQPPLVAPTPAASPQAKASHRVLLVEDDEAIRSSALELLDGLGHRVLAVESAEQAREMLATDHFDILFTDVSLPGQSGVDLAREAVHRAPGLKVIIASGYGMSLTPEQETGMGRAVLLPKPYDLAGIGRALAQLDGADAPAAG